MNKLPAPGWRKNPILIIFPFVVLLIVSFLLLFLKKEHHTFFQEKQVHFESVSQPIVNRLSDWYLDELQDAGVIARHFFLDDLILRFMKSGRAEDRDRVLRFMHSIQEEHDYDEVMLFFPDGSNFFSTAEVVRYDDQSIRPVVEEVFRCGKSLTTDLYYDQEQQKVLIDFIAPVPDEEGNLVAAIALQMDPRDYLFPLLQSWPSPGASSEMYLFRDEGDSLRVLTPLRFWNQSALTPVFSASAPSFAMGRARTESGLIRALNYQGKKVYAYLAKVPGTPWFFIAEADQKEMESDLKGLVWATAVFALLLVVVFGTGSLWIYNARRKRYYRDLYASQQAFRDLFMKHPAVKLIFDPSSGEILDANPAAERYYGWPAEEIKGMHVSRLFVGTDEELRDMIRLICGGERNFFSRKQRLADGTLRSVDVFCSCLELNAQPCIHCIMHDVTERKMAEEKLKLLSQSVEHSPVSVVITDPQGNIEYVNSYFTQTSGYELSEVMGQNPRMMNSGKTPKGIYEQLWKTILSGQNWTGELLNRRKDGSEYWEHLDISSIVDEEGVITHFVCVRDDVSREKQMIQELVEAKTQAEEGERVKTAFLQNMSHEIRTPLNGILGFADLLLLGSLPEGKVEQYARIILSSGRRLKELLDNIIDYSRLEAGTLELNMADFIPCKLMQHVQEGYADYSAKSGIEVRLVCSAETQGKTFRGDETKLRQVFDNLVGNSFKFSKKGSIILSCNKQESELVFSVEDMGCGIPAEQMSHIFDRFYQVDIALNRGFEGAGMGLAICRALLTLMGGRIWAESEVGKGTVVYFSIPCLPVDMGESKFVPSPVGDAPTEAGLGVILVAEDDHAGWAYFEAVLSSEGYKPIRVSNGMDAVEACQSNEQICLVLMDLKMPVLDGIEATRRIKALRPGLPVVAQTAFAFDAEKQLAVDAGCDEYLVKPIRRDVLVRTIVRFLK